MEKSYQSIDIYLQKYKRITFYFMISWMLFATIPSLLFLFYTINETNELGKSLLGQDRFDARMNDSYLFSFILFICTMLIFLPVFIILKKMFKRYSNFITELSKTDFEKFNSIQKQENFIAKYMPSFIIKEETVTFFSSFKQNTIRFYDIKNISIDNYRIKGRNNAMVRIKTTNNLFVYRLQGSLAKIDFLIVDIKHNNPATIITQINY